VYLDQKDFSRMAQGASGAPAYANDREAHTVLTGLVEKGAVTIYFSSSHIVEALRYKGDRADRLNAYCEVVDTLTRGHCLVIANELRRRELEIHLAREFSFHTALDAESFAFGKHADALSADPVTGPSMKELVRAAVRRDLAARGDLNRNQRRRLLAKIEKDSGLRTLFEQFPDETFDEMLRLFPFLPPNSTRAHVMDLIFSSGEKNARAERDFADAWRSSDISSESMAISTLICVNSVNFPTRKPSL
jgi:hypothetical protein